MASRVDFEDIQGAKDAIIYMRQVIEDQRSCYQKMIAAANTHTPQWQGEIRTSFDQKLDEYIQKNNSIGNTAEELFTWSLECIRLAEERDALMRG